MPESTQTPASLRAPQTPVQVAMRFQAHVSDLDRALRVLSESTGFVHGSVARSVDDPSFCIMTMVFSDIGAYRKALSRFEVKATVIPFLSTTLDEISTYEVLSTFTPAGTNEYTSAHAEDSQEAELGSAAQAHVPPLSGVEQHR